MLSLIKVIRGLRGMRRREHQSGFGTVKIVLTVSVIAVMAVTGLVLYQQHKPNSANNSAATSQTQATTQPQSTTTTQPAAATAQYLTIKEWGVKLPLSGNIKDAYYEVSTGSVDANGQPNTMWLGLTSHNGGDCDATKANKPGATIISDIGVLGRALPTDHEPVLGTLYTQLYPGVTIGKYYYFYISGTKGKTCAPAATLHSIDSAFSTAAKGIVTATAN
jgi:hypothetical protein